MSERLLPHDIAAESAVLGACMQNPRAVEYLNPEHMFRPAHEMIGEAIRHLYETGQPCDVLSVKAELEKRGEISRVGGPLVLHGHIENLPSVASASYYAKTVREHYDRRQLIAVAEHSLQHAWKLDETVDDIADAIADDLNRLRYRSDDDLSTLQTLDEFVAQDAPGSEWVLPDILARGDRLVLTGIEGAGKTTLLRQFAISAAAGVHPFTLAPCQPRSVLALDMENPLRMMIDWWGSLRDAAKKRGRPVEDGRMMLDRRPGGIDLSSVDDRRWLTRRVELVRPDLLVIGPAYKLYVGGDNSREETLARQVTSVLDGLRETVGCAIILEHHAPHGAPGMRPGHRSVRPIGSSLWLRWPEFGFGIRPAEETTQQRRIVDVLSWRGPREERPWPTRMEQGPQGWPWVESAPIPARWSA